MALAIDESIPTSNRSARSMDDTLPIHTRLPTPALDAIIACLRADAEDNFHPRTNPAQAGKRLETVWDKTLTNFSSACQYFREATWKHRIAKLEIKLDDDLSELHRMVPLRIRHMIG